MGKSPIKEKILLAEDEESLLRLETILLSSKGYRVTAVTEGRAALASIDADRPDIVILDIMLPDMDGLDVCRMIRANPQTASIPVIILTAKKNSNDVAAGLAAGANAYVTKPFKTAAVIDSIEKLLGGRI